ncbi:unnamed protein product [Caenorhabditis brenneri]
MEEEPQSLLCPECGKIYDLKETFPDCNHLYCATCFLVTNDKTCRVCESHRIDHSECSKYSTIKQSLLELEYELECEEADFIEKKIKRAQERCSKCSKSSEASMICVNCARIKMKRLENEEWIIQEIEGDVKVADEVICVECAVIDHRGHELVEVAGIQNLTDAVKNEFFLEYYHHRKSILGPFYQNIDKYKEVADSFYKVVDERNHEKEFFKTCSTQIIECYEKEKQKLTDLISKSIKLMMRLNVMYIDCLQKHIKHQVILGETATEDRKKSIENLLYKLSSTQKKFENFVENYPKVQLTPGDIEEIDGELNARMETLEVEYKKGLMVEIELEKGSKFHKFQAILKEAEEINFPSIASEIFESPANDYFMKCQQSLNFIRENDDGQGNFEEAIKFLEMEIMQTEIRFEDTVMKKMYENHERLIFLELMKLKFFPITPEADAMDAVYNLFGSIRLERCLGS